MDRTRWDRASATLQPGPIESPQHDKGPSNFYKWARVNFHRWAKVSCQTQALDKDGNTIDFYLSPTRNAKAAKRVLGKALNGLKDWEKPTVSNTDKAPTYGIAISELKAEGKCPEGTVHRQVKYLNNVVEADHGKLKQLIRQVRGFKTLKTAYATIMGFEVMRALRKGQAAIFNLTQDIRGGRNHRVTMRTPTSLTPEGNGNVRVTPVHAYFLQQSPFSGASSNLTKQSESLPCPDPTS
jgi:hypothetical protein